MSGHKQSVETKRKIGNPSSYGFGQQARSWQGGKRKKDNRWFIYKLEHPFTQSNNYIAQSRLVAEKCLGRYLTKKEVIHHINENKSDDRPENLYLFENQGKHIIYHRLKNKKIITKSNL